MKSSASDSYAEFEDAVRSNFQFLEDQYGFQLRHNKQIGYAKIIRYESSLVYVSLMYGPPAYEPAISFGRIGVDDQPSAYSFEQGDLVQLESCSSWSWKADYPNHLVGLISEFARLLKNCGAACLRGDQATFEEMKVRRDNAVRAWRQEERTSCVRKDAQSAWDSKDYDTVVKLYESIRNALTDTEKRKLEYAKGRLTG